MYSEFLSSQIENISLMRLYPQSHSFNHNRLLMAIVKSGNIDQLVD